MHYKNNYFILAALGIATLGAIIGGYRWFPVNHTSTGNVAAAVVQFSASAPDAVVQTITQQIHSEQATVDTCIRTVAQERILNAAQEVCDALANSAPDVAREFMQAVKSDVHHAHTIQLEGAQSIKEQAAAACKRLCSCNVSTTPEQTRHTATIRTDMREVPYQLQGYTAVKVKKHPNNCCSMHHTVYLPQSDTPQHIAKHILEHELTHVRYADHALFEKFSGIPSFGKKAQEAWKKFLCALEFRADAVSAACGTVADAKAHEQARKDILAFVEEHQLKNNGTHPTSQERYAWATKIRRLKEFEVIC
ncbi:MAG: hypothetical protein WCE21_01810 [Candidatus Babeliales bacterium]